MSLLLVIAMLPTLLMPGQHIAGKATWYGTGPGRGHAAAGPALRHVLGSHWRGMKVRVCNLSNHCVRVVLDDWCGCPYGRVIDLSDEDFRSLAPLWRGVISVNVWR